MDGLLMLDIIETVANARNFINTRGIKATIVKYPASARLLLD